MSRSAPHRLCPTLLAALIFFPFSEPSTSFPGRTFASAVTSARTEKTLLLVLGCHFLGEASGPPHCCPLHVLISLCTSPLHTSHPFNVTSLAGQSPWSRDHRFFPVHHFFPLPALSFLQCVHMEALMPVYGGRGAGGGMCAPGAGMCCDEPLCPLLGPWQEVAGVLAAWGWPPAAATRCRGSAAPGTSSEHRWAWE